MKQFYLWALLLVSATQAQVAVNFGNSVCTPGDCTTVFALYENASETTSYMVEAIAYNPQPYDGIVVPFAADDIWSEAIPLGFNFEFYGTSYHQIYLGTNGVISFDVDSYPIFQGNRVCDWSFSTPIPNVGFPIKNAIYGAYQDTDVRTPPIVNQQAQHISYHFGGIAPFRTLTISFTQLPTFGCNDAAGLQSSQITLQETTNEIIVNIGSRTPCNTWNGGRGVIGIQNSTGTNAVSPPGRNTGNWSATNEAWKFIPTGGAIASIQWFLNGVAIVGANATELAVCPDETSVYGAAVTYDDNGNLTNFSAEVLIPVGTGLEANPDPSDLYVCSDIGMATFDLTHALTEFLGGDNPENFGYGFFTSQADAVNFANPIAQPHAFTAVDGTVIYLSAENYLYASGCLEVRSLTLHVGSGLPQGDATQYFEPGQTLNDLDVSGNGITWYDLPQGGNLLPGETPLVHNTTYYAQSLPVPGCEDARGSVLRLAVTALQENLATAGFNLNAIKIAPNPVDAQFTIGGLQAGYSIQVTNLLGQKITDFLSADITSTIDTANWASGTYLIRISDTTDSRTIKVIKS